MKGIAFLLFLLSFNIQVGTDRIGDLENALLIVHKRMLQLEKRLGNIDDTVWDMDDKIESNIKKIKESTKELNITKEESTETMASLRRLSEKEERHHDEVILHKEKIQNIEQQSATLTEKVHQLSTRESKNRDEIEQLQHQSSSMSEKIETLADKDALKNVTEEMTHSMKTFALKEEVLVKSMENLAKKEEVQSLRNITEVIKSQTDHTDQKVRSLSQSMDSLTKKEEVLQNVTEAIKSQTDHTDQKVQSLSQSLEMLSSKMEELNERGMVDVLHPIGSIYISFANVEPPKNGRYGVVWEKLPEGYVLMTANNGNVGTTNGGQRLDSGNTEGHQLTVAQMPSHSHQYERYDFEEHYGYSGGNYVPYHMYYSHTTTSTGGDEAHSHNLNIFNHKVLVWRRTA